MKDIVGYEGRYSVTEDGRVYSHPKSGSGGHNGMWKILQKRPHRSGDYYLVVSLTKDGKDKQYYVHRLVAETYIENPEGKSEVNHKDGNKANNHKDNLEWVSPSENRFHAVYTGLLRHEHQKKKIVCLETGQVFQSITEAIELFGGGVSHVLTGRNGHCKGFHFSYL